MLICSICEAVWRGEMIVPQLRSNFSQHMLLCILLLYLTVFISDLIIPAIPFKSNQSLCAAEKNYEDILADIKVEINNDNATN